VALEPLAAEGQLGARQREAVVDVLQDLLGRPRQDGTDGELGEAALRRTLAELADNVEVHPVVVRDQHRLRRALLARRRVGVLVALPHDVVHFGRIGSEDLPVEARVLELHLASQVDGELLGDGLRAGEKAHARVAAHHDLVHHGAVAVDVVDVRRGQSAVDEHPNVLLHADGHLPVDLAQRLVAHEEGGARLQRADLEREVERRDH